MAEGWFYLEKREAKGPAGIDTLVTQLQQE